jgi:hypothetical protein
MSKRAEASLREMRLIRKKFGLLFIEVEKVLFESDPIWLNSGFNTDEYEPEVRTILPRLKPSCTVQDVLQIVYCRSKKWLRKH